MSGLRHRVIPMRLLLFVVSSLLCVLVLAFTAMLNIASFNQNYTQSINNGYSVVAKEVAQKLEYSVNYGKPLDNFYGIKSILGQITKEAPTIHSVRLALPNGTVVDNQNGHVTNQSIPSTLLNQLDFHKSTLAGSSLAFSYHGHEDVFLPIYKSHNQLAGMLVLTYSRATLSEITRHYARQLLIYIALLTGIAIAAVSAFVLSVPLRSHNKKLRTSTILTFLVTLLTSLQIVYGIMNYEMFRGAYRQLNNTSTRLASVVVQHDIDSVIRKGISYTELYGVRQYLQSIQSSVPEIGDIVIANAHRTPMYASKSIETSANPIDVRLTTDSTGHAATLRVFESATYLAQKTRKLILDAATVLVTSILFSIEVTLAMLFFVRQRLTRARLSTEMSASDEDDSHADEYDFGLNHTDFIIRPLTFLMSTAVFMSATFIPVVTESLYQPLLHFPASVVIALPNSADSLLGALATIAASVAIERFGWKRIFICGLFILAVGAVLSAISGRELIFVAARGIAGAGYGAGLLAVRAFVNRTVSPKARSAALSGLYAGLYGGMNFGSTVGSMLADRLGTTTVFAISSCIAISAMILTLFVVRERGYSGNLTSTLPTSEPVLMTTEDMTNSDKQDNSLPLFQFFSNSRVLGFYILVLLPTAIAGTFLNYFFPLFANASGLSNSAVGRAFLLNGICIVYLGPILTRFFLRVAGVKKSLLIGVAAVTVGMFIFAVSPNIFTGFTVIILLGLADGFGLVAQTSYYVGLKASRTIGPHRALGFQGIVRKLGQMIGPIVFGAFAVVNYHIGFAIIGVGMAFFAIIFLWNTRREPEVYVKG